MSKVIVELQQLSKVLQLTADEQLVQIRVFAQYRGIDNTPSNDDTPILKFTTVPCFSAVPLECAHHSFFIGEKCYQRAFIELPPPQVGDILDLQCYVQSGRIEITQLERLSIREIARLRDFMTSDFGKAFLDLTGM